MKGSAISSDLNILNEEFAADDHRINLPKITGKQRGWGPCERDGKVERSS
jgi:hypothetical protein